MMAAEEKRSYPRLTLKIEDGYFGHFKLANQDSLLAPIVNLSVGGLSMAVAENAENKIKDGDLLMLRNIVGGANLAFLCDIKAEIRWIKKSGEKNMSVGCRFHELTEELHRQLAAFVDTERKTRGQYA